MRQKNWRLVIVGGAMIVAGIAFFFGMMSLIPRSNDPATLMRTVGQVAGVVGGLGVAMMMIGLIGKASRA